MIRLQQIKKCFQDKVGINEVLRGIDLDVMEGEFVSIMGPSGAGKSLLLSILGMYDSAWQGEYYFLDQAIHRLNPKQRGELNKRYVGFVFQQFHLLDDLTVAENFEIPPFLSRHPKVGTRGAGGGHAGSHRHGRPQERLSEPALWRSPAIGSCGSGDYCSSAFAFGR